jgi:molybdenum cofactor cytidylyltransferase
MIDRKRRAAGFGFSTAAVLLAAGSSTRFGGRKLLAPFSGRPLLQRAIDAACASRVLSCVLVVGADADAIMDCVDTRRCAIVRNDDWRDGIAASIRTGLRFAADSDACVFMLADQPFVTSDDIDALFCSADLYGRQAIVALKAGKTWGAPVLFPRRDYSALAHLRGDSGAKNYAQTQPGRMRFVTARDLRAFRDVDSASDLRSLEALLIG